MGIGIGIGMGMGINFLKRTPVSQEITPSVDTLNYMNLKISEHQRKPSGE